MADYNAIVIGAGCGGLSVAAQLAKQGRKTLVLEQAERIGGCCSTFERDGFKFDLGASIVEATELMNRAFERLSTSIWKEVDLIPCEPLYTVFLSDGTHMTIPKSIEATAEEIGRISPQDIAGWKAFCAYMQGFTAQLNDFFVTPTLTGADMLKIFAGSPKLLSYLPLFTSSYQDVIKKFFVNEKIRESLAYQTFFIGLPPELAPGIFAVIPYQEHDGLYYARGGMIGIPEGLKRAGLRHGMELRLNTAVKRVMLRNGRAMGVILEDGRTGLLALPGPHRGSPTALAYTHRRAEL